MYSSIISKKAEEYYRINLISKDKSHIIDISVGKTLENIMVTISKSEDGLNFKSPCDEASDLKLTDFNNIEEAYDYIKKYFLDKVYKFHESF